MKKKQKLNIREMILAAEAKTVMVNSGRSGSLNTYSVDPDWDSMDNVDVNDFLR